MQLFLRIFLVISVILENHFKNVEEHNSKTEQIVGLENIEGQLL